LHLTPGIADGMCEVFEFRSVTNLAMLHIL